MKVVITLHLDVPPDFTREEVAECVVDALLSYPGAFEPIDPRFDLFRQNMQAFYTQDCERRWEGVMRNDNGEYERVKA